MSDERFMRHNYGASGYVEPTEGALTPREEKIARVQTMCTEGFCNISIADKEAIREVLHTMYDAVAANTAEFEGHKLTIADHQKEVARLTEALALAITEKRKEQTENTKLRESIQKFEGYVRAECEWHLRQAERVLINAEESEAALNSKKYGTDELHECKVAIWKALDKLPENL